jgi:hypothetical protein
MMSIEQLVTVNEYHLTGENTRIVFRNGDGEDVVLEYNEQVFRGRTELHVQQTELGLVVTALVESAPDRHTISISVTVPEANRPSSAKSIEVNTFAVLSTKRTSIGGPALVEGQIQTYTVVPLQGNAW